MIDPATCDPATLPASKEFDALVAEWRGWERNGNWWCKDDLRLYEARVNYAGYWSPSTNYAHAVEAMMKACQIVFVMDAFGVIVDMTIEMGGAHGKGDCAFTETNGDKLKALALAACRAIAAASLAAKNTP